MKPYLLIAILFIIYAGLFIDASSFIAIDGQRYYTIADDGLISMRYAWNLAHGNGLVWNAGEKVEGITNPLYTILCAPIILIFGKRVAILIIQIAAMITLLGIAWTFKKIAEQLKLNKVTTILLFITPLLYYPIFYWTMRGMEPGLICLFVSLATLMFMKSKYDRCTSYLIIAFLIRPDVVIIMAIFGMFILGTHRKDFLRYALMCFVAIISVELLRYAYYGELFPNTYILKMTGMATLDRIRFGIEYDIATIRDTGYIFLAGIISLIFRSYKFKILFFAIATSMTLYLFYCGGDAFMFFRIIAPYMPFLFIGIAMQLDKVNKYASIAIILFLLCYPHTDKIISRYHREATEETNINIAIELNAIMPIGSSVGLLWAGSVPYYTNFYGIDFLGKSDKYIASLPPDTTGAVSWGGMHSVPGHNKYDLNYSICKKHPTYIQTYSWGSQNAFQCAQGNYRLFNLPFKSVGMTNNEYSILIAKEVFAK